MRRWLAKPWVQVGVGCACLWITMAWFYPHGTALMVVLGLYQGILNVVEGAARTLPDGLARLAPIRDELRWICAIALGLTLVIQMAVLLFRWIAYL